jgi:hypothetical protein
MPIALPSVALAWLLSACEQTPQSQATQPLPASHLETIQNAEALKYEIEERDLQQRRIDELLGRGQPPAR